LRICFVHKQLSIQSLSTNISATSIGSFGQGQGQYEGN